jgi:hypothetical protein
MSTRSHRDETSTRSHRDETSTRSRLGGRVTAAAARHIRAARREASGTAVAGLAALALLAAGCSSAAPRTANSPVPAALSPLVTTLQTASGTGWAVVVMGGSAKQFNNFWELFVRPAGSTAWREATPSGVADNGGLVVAGTGPAALVTGFRPSQDLHYSPLADTTDDGARWSTGTLVYPGLANVPDSLSAGPGGQLLALTQDGKAERGTRLGAAWSTLTTEKSLAATAPGRACKLTTLTAVAFSSAGLPLLGGTCGHPGTVGIFALRAGNWTRAGPALPAALARDDVEVLQLATTATSTEALLLAGTGAHTTVLAADTTDGGSSWSLSPALATGRASIRSASLGPAGSASVVLGGGHGDVLTGPAAAWRALPPLPRWTATLALGPSGRIDALTARRGAFADWQLTSPAAWTHTQSISVQIPYGSSS